MTEPDYGIRIDPKVSIIVFLLGNVMKVLQCVVSFFLVSILSDRYVYVYFFVFLYPDLDTYGYVFNQRGIEGGEWYNVFSKNTWAINVHKKTS